LRNQYRINKWGKKISYRGELSIGRGRQYFEVNNAQLIGFMYHMLEKRISPERTFMRFMIMNQFFIDRNRSVGRFFIRSGRTVRITGPRLIIVTIPAYRCLIGRAIYNLVDAGKKEQQEYHRYGRNDLAG
jgi:hypothetical protein